MSFSVQMPALGESVTEGTVTRWLKQEGDQVEVDEPLLEVSTDKVDTEIPSPAAGCWNGSSRARTRPSRSAASWR
jgi:2-oxoglutarate dehydrogenase E2 component (dihydrolipoamide succinyltransferase)